MPNFTLYDNFENLVQTLMFRYIIWLFTSVKIFSALVCIAANLKYIFWVRITRAGRSIVMFYFSCLNEVVEAWLPICSQENIFKRYVGVHETQEDVAIVDLNVISRIVKKM